MIVDLEQDSTTGAIVSCNGIYRYFNRDYYRKAGAAKKERYSYGSAVEQLPRSRGRVMHIAFDTGKLCGVWTPRSYNQTTASGKPFWVADPRPQDIRIQDIAAHLSRLCRFGGALRDDIDHYSVAQHCVLVSWHVPTGFELEGLLHDAAEAYVGDLIKPVKMQVAGFEAVEDRVDAAIRKHFRTAGDHVGRSQRSRLLLPL